MGPVKNSKIISYIQNITLVTRNKAIFYHTYLTIVLMIQLFEISHSRVLIFSDENDRVFKKIERLKIF